MAAGHPESPSERNPNLRFVGASRGFIGRAAHHECPGRTPAKPNTQDLALVSGLQPQKSGPILLQNSCGWVRLGNGVARFVRVSRKYVRGYGIGVMHDCKPDDSREMGPV